MHVGDLGFYCMYVENKTPISLIYERTCMCVCVYVCMYLLQNAKEVSTFSVHARITPNDGMGFLKHNSQRGHVVPQPGSS